MTVMYLREYYGTGWCETRSDMNPGLDEWLAEAYERMMDEGWNRARDMEEYVEYDLYGMRFFA